GLPVAPSVLLQMVGPRVADQVLATLHDAYPDRFPLSATLANYAEGRDEIVVVSNSPRSADAILRDALDALADEIRHLLDEGVVTRDGDAGFVYAASAAQTEQARQVVEAELREAGLEARSIAIERWLADEERWDDDPETPDWEEEVTSRGFAPWEVRVERESH